MSSDCICSVCENPCEDADPSFRQPCAVCGSKTRIISASVHMKCESKMYLKTRALHRDGGKKVVREVTEGDDYHRLTGKWTVMRRLIDRTNNWYEEIFRDRETGVIVHQTAEPLTEHTHEKKQQKKLKNSTESKS